MDITICPQGRFLSCGEELGAPSEEGMPTRTGACGDPTLDLEVSTEPAAKPAGTAPQYDLDGDGIADRIPAFNERCGFGAIRREFREGGQVICTQFFVYRTPVSLDPSSIIWPEDATVNCGEILTQRPQFSDVPCGEVSVTVESDTISDIDGFCFAFLNTWTVIDWCTFDRTNGAEGKFTMIQEVSVEDNSAPVIEVAQNLSFDLTSNTCILASATIPVSASDSDNCPSEPLVWEIAVDYFSDGEIDQFVREESNSGDTFDLNLIQLPASKTTHSVRWAATDLCGNTTIANTTFTVNDVIPPTPYCLAVTTMIDTISGTFELWAVDFNAGATDNCSDTEDLRFSFSDVEPPTNSGFYFSANGAAATEADFNNGLADSYDASASTAGRIFTEADLDFDGTLSLSIYAWDECGNSDFCLIRTLIRPTVVGSRYAIHGNFETEEGAAVGQVEAKLKDYTTGNIKSDVTTFDGQYAFDDNLISTNYMVKGYKDDNYLNGVSTLDLIYIQRHILGQSLLASPYKMIAADVTKDNRINGTDLVELRKLILGIYTELPRVDSWQFVDKYQKLTLDNPWVYRDSIMIENLSTAMMQEDFVGVKMGDVNNSVVTSSNKSLTGRSNGQLLLYFEDQHYDVGQELDVVITVSEYELYGYQFGLTYEGLELLDVASRDITDDNMKILENSLLVSHNSDYLLDSEEAFLTLKFRTSSRGKLSETLRIDNSRLKSEGYVGKYLDIFEMGLAKEGQAGFKLYQNRPNPFSDYTTIEFDLPEAAKIKLSLYDITGKIFKTITRDFSEGRQSIRLSKNELGTSGVIYYRLESGQYTAMKQMIIME